MKKLIPLLFSGVCLLSFVTSCKKDPTSFTVPPSISAISPAAGMANTAVTITGTNFKALASDNTVKFNGQVATVTNATNTALMVLAPAGATTGPITVSTSEGTATGPVFTYQTAPAPAIASLSPTSGAAGTTVTITGTNFDATAANDIVKFNGVTATVTSATSTSIVATAPATGTTGNVTVTTGGGTSNGLVFTYSTGPDVYIVGQDGSSAVIWKNGTESVLGPGRAVGVFVSGSDVYVAGNGAGNEVCRYWKNGMPVLLPAECVVVKGITVVGQNVYVLGQRQYLSSTGVPTTVAAVWQNGVRKDVAPDTTITSYPGGIVYAQNDVFVSAWYGNQFFTGTGTVIQTRAFYYPPFASTGIPNFLTDSKTDSWASSIGASPNGAVFVGGYTEDGATVWSDGLVVWQDPFHSGQTGSQCSAVASSGTIISVAGTFVEQRVRAFVKNIGGDNAYTVLEGANATYNSYATAVAIDSNDVYVAGFTGNDGPVYWKNGVKTVLPHTGSADFAGTYSIYIKKN